MLNTTFALCFISTIVALCVSVPVEVAIWRSSNWKFKLVGVVFQAIVLYALCMFIFKVCDITITAALDEIFKSSTSSYFNFN